MEKQEIVLKKSKRKLIVRIVISGLIAVGCIVNAFMFWVDKEGQWMIILGGLVSLVACIYYLKEWRDHKIELVISTEGIRLRGEGFFSWSSIEKFSTDVDEGNVTLILHVKDRDVVEFGITSLEIKKKELVELILTYGQPAGLYYTKQY